MLSVIIALIVIGVLLYIVDLLPMDATIKKIIQVLVILLIVLWTLSFLAPGLMGWKHAISFK